MLPVVVDAGVRWKGWVAAAARQRGVLDAALHCDEPAGSSSGGRCMDYVRIGNQRFEPKGEGEYETRANCRMRGRGGQLPRSLPLECAP